MSETSFPRSPPCWSLSILYGGTAGNPASGLLKAQKLVLEDHVKLLIGGASSAVTMGTNAQAARLNAPIVTTNAQAVPITGEQCSRFMFRTVPHDGNTAKASAVMFSQRPDLLERNWFVVYHDYAYGQSNKALFAQIPNIKIAGEAGRSVGTADWSSAIAQIQSSKVDGIYLALAVGDDLTASWMQEDTNPQISELVKAYYDEYGIVPGYQAIQAYAGMQFVLSALEAADDLTTDQIIASLENTVAETVVGPIDIMPEDHQGLQGDFVAEAVILAEPKHGASIGWKPVTYMGWDDINVLP